MPHQPDVSEPNPCLGGGGIRHGPRGTKSGLLSVILTLNACQKGVSSRVSSALFKQLLLETRHQFAHRTYPCSTWAMKERCRNETHNSILRKIFWLNRKQILIERKKFFDQSILFPIQIFDTKFILVLSNSTHSTYTFLIRTCVRLSLTYEIR